MRVFTQLFPKPSKNFAFKVIKLMKLESISQELLEVPLS
jgi:hypothetical protein